MGPPAFIEYTLGKLFSYCKGHDARAFTKGPAFAQDHPLPTLSLTSPECGASGSPLHLHHSQVGPDAAHRDRFPHLTWPAVEGAKEYILLCEDVDLPIPGVVVFHGLFYGLPPTRTGVTAEDVEPVGDHEEPGNGAGSGGMTKGGFKYVKNIQGAHYGGPKPVIGHGVHRYFYQLVALREPVDTGKMAKVTKDGLGRAIVGNVLGWGQWIGTYERKWE